MPQNHAPMRLKILYAEGNEQVLASQTPSIQQAGHEVTTAIGRKPVTDALQRGAFDLVILGSSLTRDDRHHLPYMVKKSKCGARVLVMHADGARHPEVDGNIDSGRPMEELLAKIASMLSEQVAAH